MSDAAVSEIFVVRRPVLTRQQELYGYQLLFHTEADRIDPEGAHHESSFEMLHTVLLGFGLDALLGERLGFITVSPEVLLQELYHVLPRERSIIELADGVEPTAELMEACRALRSAGYHLALDDFVRRPELAPLADMADVLLVDFERSGEADRRAVVREFAPRKVRLVAERVETREAYQVASGEGYTHFSGRYFCEPELLRTTDVPAYKRNCIQFMTELNRPELDFDRLERVIKQEVALAVKLLRYLNSAGFGWRHEVTSIKHALRVLGERAARKWCSLIALTVLGNDRPTELVVTSLVRASFLEQLGREAGLGSREMDFFLTGLLSTLDGLLGLPMEEALGNMPVANEIRHTLLGRRTSLSPVWALALAYEKADWAQVKELADLADVSVGRLPGLYRNAVQWVDRIFQG